MVELVVDTIDAVHRLWYGSEVIYCSFFSIVARIKAEMTVGAVWHGYLQAEQIALTVWHG